MKKRSFNQIETSESDEDSGPGSRAQMTPRSSDRLKTRANRQFRLPSRDEVLSRILPKGSKETPSKSLAELRPRKLVNNFLKVNNRYNYDPDFTDSDTSLGGFLDDEEENEKEEEENSTSDGEDDEDGSRSQTNSSSSEEEECLKHSKRPKGKQKLREIRKEKLLDRETDSDDEDTVCTTTKKRRRRQSSVLDDSSSNEDQPEEGREKSRRAESLRRKKRKQNFFEEYKAKRALRKAKV